MRNLKEIDMTIDVLKKARHFELPQSGRQILSTFSGLLILCIAFSLLSEYFFSLNNFLTVAAQTAVIAIIAIGQTYV